MTHPAPVDVPTRDLFRLDGRTILISGGAGAVGTTVGKAILESGGDAVFVDMAPSPNAETWKAIEEIAAANGTKAWYHQLNVTDADSVPRVFDTIRDELRSPLRGLVACAGISGECDACDYPIDAFRKILDVNINGTFLVTQAVAKEMHRANVTGSLVLIASMSGWVSNKGINTAPYNASKSALHQLARSLAAEWGHPQNTFPGRTPGDANPNPQAERKAYPPIRVNTISPGHIETPISEAARVRGLTDEWAKQNMLGRISQAEEYRAPVLFLLGEGSSYMTGADLRIDGGHCAW
ncbi:NAD(P)-binding protein [Trematosphaeria pertusa]|uniref:NAD(P)-binding protein n=1 Tax=Trematosphaeria pertusa TaxID=390896 RepID=A0A6A6I9Y8_9PLEO|nr:NAD(P)-binding protein [Trematosphaeria pertusa]KAF2247191.1 NAD(P)-binding protein [Trematosphaeria pertusa]